ncbi:MAG: hypothetical protein JSV69_08350, partial [Chloroflexota bacterium]
RFDKNHLQDLNLRDQQTSKTTRGVKAGVDPLKLSSAGWGIIFANEDDDQIAEVKEALGGLLDLRKSQAGELYQEFAGEAGYQRGENYLDFLSRHSMGPGPADPERVPYYLLIIGSPEIIPFDFQYQLDVQYAVGRIYFDTPDQYAQYAQSVVAMETDQASTSRRATFFGVQNQDDPATQLSATQLVQPLSENFSTGVLSPGWKIQSIVGEQATKSSLTGIIGGDNPPALFFSASHGMGFPKDDPRQLPHQGALLCQDWPGPQSWKESIPEDYYFSADDIPSRAKLAGSIAFFFACYGAGTPQMDDFAHQAFLDPKAIAPRNFLARLPQGLLSHPKGGMQAVIGHVERAWGYSFTWEQSGSQLAVFESALKSLMDGFPVGYAMEYFNARYAELSTILSTELQGVQFGKLVDDVALAGKWTANNDARSYVVIGDPAVRLHFERAEIEKTSASEIAVSPGREDLDREEPPGLSKSDEIEVAPYSVADVKSTFDDKQLGSHLENLNAEIVEYQAELATIPAKKRIDQQHTQIRLANSYKTLYELTDNPDFYDEAEQLFSLLLDDLSIEKQTRELAAVRFNLAHLNHLKYQKNGGIESADRAMQAYQQLLGEITYEDMPFIWSQTHYYLASLHIILESSHNDLFNRNAAIDSLGQALAVFTTDQHSYQFVDAKIKQGDLLLNQMEGDREENLELAINAYESTLDKLSAVVNLISEAAVYVRLGDAFAQRIKGDKNNNEFQALAYYKQSLASIGEKQDPVVVEEIKQKISQLQSRN